MELNGTEPPTSGTQDVNKDHIKDLTVSFSRQDLSITGLPGTTGSIYLQGRLIDETTFAGRTSVTLK